MHDNIRRPYLVGQFKEVPLYGHETLSEHLRGAEAIESILRAEDYIPKGASDEEYFQVMDEYTRRDVWMTLVNVAEKYDIDLDWGLTPTGEVPSGDDDHRAYLVEQFDEIGWCEHKTMSGHERGEYAIESILRAEGYIPKDASYEEFAQMMEECTSRDVWVFLVDVAEKYDIELDWGLTPTSEWPEETNEAHQ